MSVAIVVLILVVTGARLKSAGWILHAERFLNGAGAVIAVGGFTAAAILFVWGSIRPEPLISDEASYLFQAKLFAAGRWSAPSPPHPEFFEQTHVLVTPRYASKYPPGHAFVLSPGVAVGLTALMPIVLSGFTGALIFLLARSVANPWVAVLTWILWLSSPANLRFRPTFFSEVTTSALWLAGWYAVLQWYLTRRASWLVWLAAFVGLGTITRPLTMFAFALPTGIFVLWAMAKSEWKIPAAAAMLLVGFLALIPLWSARVTGDWRRTPLLVYTQTYMPWDVPGLGLRTTPALRTVPADMEDVFGEFREEHRRHTLKRLPRVALERVMTLGGHLTAGWRTWLLPAAVVGLLFLGGPGWIALACGMTLFVAYLTYAHPPSWTLYYTEAFPLLAFCLGLGLWAIARYVTAKIRADDDWTRYTGAATVSFLLLLFFSSLSLGDVVTNRDWRHLRATPNRAFHDLLARIPEEKAMVFVRYGPNHYKHGSLIDNEPDLADARVWLMYDHGERNTQLTREFPNRAAYLYDESTGVLTKIVN